MRVGEVMSVLSKSGLQRLRVALLASVLFVPGAHADTLTDAFMKAYQSNPQLAAERANLRATDEEVAQAIAQWRPRVSISADYSKVQSENKTDLTPSATFADRKTESWNADITATQTVFAGGRILAQRRQADAQVKAGRAILHSTDRKSVV